MHHVIVHKIMWYVVESENKSFTIAVITCYYIYKEVLSRTQLNLLYGIRISHDYIWPFKVEEQFLAYVCSWEVIKLVKDFLQKLFVP